MGSHDATSSQHHVIQTTDEVTHQQLADGFALLDGALPLDVGDPEQTVRFLDHLRPPRGGLTVEWLTEMALSSAPSSTGKSLHHPPMGTRLVVDVPSAAQQDTLCILSLLGTTRTDGARVALRPYLHSHHLHERWVSAIWLGYLHDDQALPILSDMLTTVFPTQEVWAPDGGSQYCFTGWRNRVPEILQRWGSSECISILRAALITVVTREQAELIRPTGTTLSYRWADEIFTGDEALRCYYSDLSQWVTYEHRFIYSLGYLGAFGALFGIETPVGVYSADGDYLEQELRRIPPKPRTAHQHPTRFRANVWRVHACCGFLESTYSVRQKRVYAFTETPDFAEAVANLLNVQFGLDRAAQHEAMNDYEAAAFLSAVTRYYERLAHQIHV